MSSSPANAIQGNSGKLLLISFTILRGFSLFSPMSNIMTSKSALFTIWQSKPRLPTLTMSSLTF